MHFLDGEGEKSERRRSPPDRPPPMNNSWSCSVDEWTTIIIGKLKKSFGPEQPKPSITPFLLSDTTRTSTTPVMMNIRALLLPIVAVSSAAAREGYSSRPKVEWEGQSLRCYDRASSTDADRGPLVRYDNPIARLLFLVTVA